MLSWTELSAGTLIFGFWATLASVLWHVMGHCHVERSSQSRGRTVPASIFFSCCLYEFSSACHSKECDCIEGFPAVILRSAYAEHREPNRVLSERRIFSELSKECSACIWAEHQLRCDTSLFETNSFKRAEQIEKRRNGRFWNCQVKSQTLWGKLRQAEHASKPLT